MVGSDNRNDNGTSAKDDYSTGCEQQQLLLL
jgi:hypothetical protein